MAINIILIQYRTDQSRIHEQECIINKLNLPPENITIINAFDEHLNISKINLPDYTGLITGASGQYNVTDWSKDAQTKIEQTYPLLEKAIELDTPTLGICFGHQLIAKMLGGEIERSEQQAETSAQEITLSNSGKNSLIYRHLPSHFFAALGHKDSVTKLPSKAILLASSPRCPNQSYQIGNNVFTTQFHPELTKQDVLWRLKYYPEYRFGKTIEEINNELPETPHPHKMFDNFRKILLNYSPR